MRAGSPGVSVDESRKRQGIAPVLSATRHNLAISFRRSKINVQTEESPSKSLERRLTFNSPAPQQYNLTTSHPTHRRPRRTRARLLAVKSFAFSYFIKHIQLLRTAGYLVISREESSVVGLGSYRPNELREAESVGFGESVKSKRDNGRSQTILVGDFCYLLADRAAPLSVTTRPYSHLLVGTAVLVVFAGLLFTGSTSSSAAKGDRTAPTAPTNLVAGSIGETSVTLSWNPSTDNSGKWSYNIKITNLQNSAFNSLATVSQSQKTYTVRYLTPNTQYSFAVYAIDGSGNKSADSNTVNISTLADTTPPTPPTLKATVLAPSASSTGPAKGIDVDFVYANAHGDNYFQVKAVDRAGNTSAASNVLKLFLWPC